jgi:small multidrug resistance pump
MMHWMLLLAAIAAEIFATSVLKLTDGFTRPLPSAGVIAGYGVSFYCLSLALRAIPVGIAYALWSGIGVVFIALIGWLFYDQKLDAAAVIGLALILAGVLVINLLSKSVGR